MLSVATLACRRPTPRHPRVKIALPLLALLASWPVAALAVDARTAPRAQLIEHRQHPVSAKPHEKEVPLLVGRRHSIGATFSRGRLRVDSLERLGHIFEQRLARLPFHRRLEVLDTIQLLGSASTGVHGWALQGTVPLLTVIALSAELLHPKAPQYGNTWGLRYLDRLAEAQLERQGPPKAAEKSPLWDLLVSQGGLVVPTPSMSGEQIAALAARLAPTLKKVLPGTWQARDPHKFVRALFDIATWASFAGIAANLHDVGKWVENDRQILDGTRALLPHERKKMEKHAIDGPRLLNRAMPLEGLQFVDLMNAGSLQQDHEQIIVSALAPMIAGEHHFGPDGTGYGFAPPGQDIYRLALEQHILSVVKLADVIDAVRTRAFRSGSHGTQHVEPLPPKKVPQELRGSEAHIGIAAALLRYPAIVAALEGPVSSPEQREHVVAQVSSPAMQQRLLAGLIKHLGLEPTGFSMPLGVE